MLSLKAWLPPCAVLTLYACASVPAPDYLIDHPANPGAAAARIDDAPDAIARYHRGFASSAPETGPHAGHAGRAEPTPPEEDAHAHHR